MVKHWTDTFLYSIIAGICIGIGGTAFLNVSNTIYGTFLFSVGLFTICTFGFNLYTGKVAYVFENKPAYIIDVIIIWLGNFTGAFLMAWLMSFTRIGDKLCEKASVLCETKMNDGLLSMFILSVFCNMLIFIAVDLFKKNPHEIGKYLGLIFGVMVFIACGFEHSVADMFYFSAAKAWSPKTFLLILVVTLGNTIGGLIIPIFKMAHKRLTAKAE